LPSIEEGRIARWVIDSGDNGRMPYVVVDKINAKVFVYDVKGQLQGSAPALLGLAKGDRLKKGTGDKTLSAIGPESRITPAGRFVASLDHDTHGKEILLIDYAESIALHAVIKGTPQERRAERLNSETSSDNRISYGCINVPLKFYEGVISPTFRHTSGVVYILPEAAGSTAIFGGKPLLGQP
jgi:hypothetical protein